MTEIRDDLWLHSPAGTLMAPGVPLTDLAWNFEENKFGVLRASGPLSEVDSSLFQLDNRFEIHRFLDGSPLGIEGDTQFLLRYWTFGEDNSGPTWSIEAYTPEYWLTGRQNFYDLTSGISLRNDYADDLIKTLVELNLATLFTGLGGYVFNPVPGLAIEPQFGLAPLVNKSCAFETLSTTIEAIAGDSLTAGTRLIYGIVKTDTGFLFKTWTGQRGQDHSSGSGDEIIISQATESLSKPGVTFDHRAEWNFVYGHGKTLYASSYDTSRINASPYALRTSKIESSQAASADAVVAIANAELQKGRPKIGFTGSFVDSDYARYGQRVFWGDKVTAEYMGYSFACRLYKVAGKYNKTKGEVLDIGLEGELV